MRVLLADSDAEFVEVLGDYLGQCGLEAETAEDGIECLARAVGGAYDALVLERDLLWGGGDGVLASLRDVPHVASLPVILMVAEGKREEFDRWVVGPVVAWLQKPFRLSELVRQLNRLSQDDSGRQDRAPVNAHH